MSSVAEQLRQAREAKNLTVNQVADTTKIRTDHIRALEEGNYEMFSAPVYIRGFVRCYAMLLKLDLPPLMTALDAELRQTGKFRELPAMPSTGRGSLDWLMFQLSKINWRKSWAALAVVIVLMALVLAVRGWRHSRAANPIGSMKPSVYRPTRSSGGDTLPLPPASPPRKS